MAKITPIKVRPHKWRTSWNNKEFPPTGEMYFGVSQTIPDQTMTIRQLEKRYSPDSSLLKDLPMPVWAQEPDPDFDDYLPSLVDLDHADRVELMEQVQFEIDEIKRKKDEMAKDRKAKRDAEKELYDQAYAEKIRKLMARNEVSDAPETLE